VVIALAVPAKRGIWKNIKLENGTMVRAELCGDEHKHYWRSVEGVLYVEAGDGSNIYKVVQKAELKRTVATRRSRRMARQRAMRRVIEAAQTPTVYTGKKKGLIILVQFNDSIFKATHNKRFYEQVANGVDFTSPLGFKGSISDYFKAQSGGLFELNFDVVGPVKLSNPASYYGSNTDAGFDRRAGKMVAQSCLAVKDSVDFSQYDWDGDGEVDQVLVIYAGMGEADGGAAASIWPHEWELSSSDYGSSLKIDSVTVNTYACGNEMQGDNIVNGIGTICHEFTHCLGLPDTYDTAYEGRYGMGKWDLMGSGNYNGDTFCPAGYTAYEKMMCGWITPEVLSADTTINAFKPLSNGGGAYIIYNDSNKNEYYLLANRQRTKWDAELPASGMLITHVDYDQNCWDNNVVNTFGTFSAADGYTADFSNDHQRLTVVHADNDDDSNYWDESLGTYDKITERFDVYPYGKKDSLTNYSTPRGMLYHANRDSSFLLNKAVKNIRQNEDGTISFSFYATSSAVSGDSTEVRGDTLFCETFDQCIGTGGNDGRWSNSIAKGDFLPDHEGWEGEYKYGADKCAKFGTATYAGVVTTPEININGTAILTFKAGVWNGKNDGTLLNIGVPQGFKITPVVTTLAKGGWTECTATITGTGKVRVQFVPVKRFFLDDVVVKKPAASTGIRVLNRENVPARDGKIYSIHGQYLGTDLRVLPKGIYIVNGTKVVK
ncbi:MAG TPA: M6 family metalloprotease domain-containing protein, partial [Prevotella sp.]